ncbi:MAG: hypothetical protein N3A54_02535 [Patescibacteria group bacterium]|nr:hypothetical protein [Patescibacteria group bacterium]
MIDDIEEKNTAILLIQALDREIDKMQKQIFQLQSLLAEKDEVIDELVKENKKMQEKLKLFMSFKGEA